MSTAGLRGTMICTSRPELKHLVRSYAGPYGTISMAADTLPNVQAQLLVQYISEQLRNLSGTLSLFRIICSQLCAKWRSRFLVDQRE